MVQTLVGKHALNGLFVAQQTNECQTAVLWSDCTIRRKFFYVLRRMWAA